MLLEDLQTYWLSEDDVSFDGKFRQSGVLVDVTDGRDFDFTGKTLNCLGDRDEAQLPRQHVNVDQRTTTEHAAIQSRVTALS